MGMSLFAAEAAGAAVEFPLLPTLVAVPLLTVAVLLVLPPSRADYVKLTALVGSLITGAISVYLMWNFAVGEAGFQFVSRYDWGGLGLSLFLGVDGISLFLVVLTGILFPVSIVTSDPHHDPKPYYLWLMLLMAGSMGAFLALDLLLFFMFFEIVLVPMYFLIGGWGHGDRISSAMKFFLYTMAASALMLVGIASLAILAAPAEGLTFDVTVLAQHNLGSLASTLIFLSFALAFAVKVPLFPVHTWLPDAHTEAPTAGSVILAGVMLKLGTYGMLRFGVYLFPQVVSDLAPIFIGLGVFGIVYGAAVATMQSDLKRLVAYSSVAHMGFIVLGIFALNSQGLSGSVIQMVNHGVSTGGLFILVGWVYERRHTRQISALGGLQKAAPLMAGVFTLVMLSSIGLPGLNGFVGEFLILLGAFSAARWWTVVAVSGVILAALYLLWAYQRSFHGPAEGDNATMRDLSIGELLGILPLLVLIVFMGVYPQPVLDRIEPSVDALIAHVESNVEGFAEAEPEQVTRAGAEGLVAVARDVEEGAESEDHGGEGEDHGDGTDHEEEGE